MKEKQGNIARVGLPRLLYSIFEKADRFAILDIIREPVKKRFYFVDGIPVAATSNILNEVLGRLLIQEGIITQKQYERSLEVVLHEKKRHGEVLISMRLLTQDQLDSFLALQLKRRLLRIFSWNDGTYRYMKADSVPAGLSRFPLHPAGLILEGISVGFYPELSLRSDLKPWSDRVLKPSASALGQRCTLDDFGLNLQEKRFFESFDGQKTLKEVLDSSDLLRQRALSLSLSFIITGSLKAEGVAAETIELEETTETRTTETGGDTRLSAELMFIKAKGSLAEGSYKDAIKTLQQITDLNPTEGEYWAHLGWAVYKDDPSKLKEAEQLIKDSIDLNNELDSAWYFLGRIFIEADDLAWAQKALTTALAKNPWMTEALYELKRLELRRKTPPASDQYKESLDRLGFRDDPFEEVPDNRFLSLPASRTDLLEKVLKDIRAQTEPVLVTGPDSSGKTTFALEIIRSLATDKALVCYINEPPEKELLLVKELNAEFGVQTESATTKELLLSLGMRVTQNRIQGGRALIIIDNAERLNTGCLKLIQYLSRIRSIQILLVAGPALSERLQNPDFAELDAKILARHVLEPLDLQESRAYIERRVRAALDATPPEGFFLLAEQAVEKIYETSGGLPGRINESAVDLITSRAAETPRLDLTDLNEATGAPEEVSEAFKPPLAEAASFEPYASFETDTSTSMAAGQEATAQFEATDTKAPQGVTEEVSEAFKPPLAGAASDEPFASFEIDTSTSTPAGQEETAQFEATDTKAPQGVTEEVSEAFKPPLTDAASDEPFISFETEAPGPQAAAPLSQKGAVANRQTPSSETKEVQGAPRAAYQHIDAYASAPQKKEEAAIPAKKGLKRVFLWVVVMLILGLIIGAIIGVFIFGYSWPPVTGISSINAPNGTTAPGQGISTAPSPISVTAPADGSAPM